MSPTRRVSSPDHKEALRLAWLSRHFPFGTIVVATLLAAGILSAILSILAVSPSNGIP